MMYRTRHEMSCASAPHRPRGFLRGCRRGARLARRRPEGGFTLVEALVVVAIVAVVAVVALPSLRLILAKARIESKVQQISSALYSARLQAIREATTARVEFGPTGGQNWIWATIDRNRNGDFESDLARVALEGTLDFAGPVSDSDGVDGWTDDRLVFRSDGSVAEAGAVRVSGNVGDDVWYYEVRVAPAAAPRIMIRKWDPLANKWVEEGDD